MENQQLEKRNIDSLSQDDLEDVAGGFVYHARMHPDYRWEVIDKNSGEVLARYQTREEAMSRAEKKFGQSKDKINWGTLKKIRQQKNKVNLDK